MSHGPSGSDIKAEPNLTPLLDMVLQLLMFFMICVNFVTEQVNEDIQLPKAQAARPMEKTEIDVLFLNLTAEGKLKVLSQDQAIGLPEIKVYLRRQYADAERVAKDGKVRTAVVIRADQNANYADVFKVMQACKEVKYNRLRFRAIMKEKPGGNA